MNPVRFEELPDSELSAVVYSSAFLDTLAVGILLRNARGEVVDFNQTAVTLLDTTDEALMGSTPFDSTWSPVHEDGSPFDLDDQPAMTTLRTGTPSSNVTIGIDVPGQPRRWLMINTFAVEIDDEIMGELCTMLEVSDRHRESQVMRLVTEVNRIVKSARNENDFLAHVCDTLVSVGGYALARLAVANTPDPRDIRTIYAAGRTEYLVDGMISTSASESIGRGPVGTALRTGHLQVFNDLTSHPDFEPWRERARQFGLASNISIALQLAGDRIVLSIYDAHAHAFDEMTVEGLKEIAREIEFGAAHVRSVHQLETALDGTISALARMTETRDPYTAGHQMHVGTLGALIAEELGLDTGLAGLIRQSGEVHDIGKISVPAEILTRPGRLSKLEYEIVKRHTLIGSDILSQASLPWPIAEVALQHHERLDGSGYPYGLRGDDIILPARIIAVADVVEAMTQHRPYRPGLGIESALEEVVRGAGTLYDAEVVAACLRVIEAGFTFTERVESVPEGG